jgi:serine/threonine protein phosphatase PrpC
MIDTQPLQFPARLTVSVISEKGCSHEQNEDCYRLDIERGLFLLADGMGGHRAGEVASRMAIEIIYQVLSSRPSGDWQQTFGNALLAAHHALRKAADENEQYRGMGTTALIGWIRLPELHLWTAHIGNSRAYLWRKGTLQQLTEDHTMLNELRKANRLPANRRDWPSPNILSQALGSRQPFLVPEFGDWRLEIGDRLLLCSDGISDVLAAQEIQQAIESSSEPQTICQHLAQAVRARGTPDDMTAILVGIESSIASETAIQTIQGMEV